MSDPIPPKLWVLIKDFCAQGKTGQITLHAKGGHILAWQFMEAGRVDADVLDKPFVK